MCNDAGFESTGWSGGEGYTMVYVVSSVKRGVSLVSL